MQSYGDVKYGNNYYQIVGLNLVLSRTVFRQGDQVFGIGAANPNDIIIKILESDKTVVNSERIQSDLHGIFTIPVYKIPSNASNWTWTVYATDGISEATQKFLVGSFSPYVQFKLGVPSHSIECNRNLKLMVQKESDLPACINPNHVLKFVERGWISVRIPHINGTMSVISGNFYCLGHSYYNEQLGFVCPI